MTSFRITDALLKLIVTVWYRGSSNGNVGGVIAMRREGTQMPPRLGGGTQCNPRFERLRCMPSAFRSIVYEDIRHWGGVESSWGGRFGHPIWSRFLCCHYLFLLARA